MASNSGQIKIMTMEVYPYDDATLARLITEAETVEAAIRASVRDALLMHKKLGNPVATWKDGQVVWIPADEIVVADEVNGSPQ